MAAVSNTAVEGARTERPGPPLLVVEDLWHSYAKGMPVIKNLSLTIGRGELLAVIGQNGSGKTTLVKHFNGILRPDVGHGVVRVFDDESGWADTRRARVHELAHSVGYVFQNPDRQIFHDTCEKELAFGLINLGVPPALHAERISSTLARVGLAGLEQANPSHLSRGQRQRLAIAAVLVMEAPLMVVDEPTTGQDSLEATEILNVFQDYVAEGRTIVIVSHDMALVASYATRVVAIRGGAVIADGSPREVFAQPEILRTTNITPPPVSVLANQLGLPGVLTVTEAADAIQSRVRRGTRGEEPATRR